MSRATRLEFVVNLKNAKNPRPNHPSNAVGHRRRGDSLIGREPQDVQKPCSWTRPKARNMLPRSD